MGLEKVFVAARTLEWLRSGPLGHLADGYCDWLMIQGFSRSWARTHLRYAFLLNAHLGAAVGRPGTRVGAGDVEGFLRAYRQGVRNRRTRVADPRRVRYSIRRFVQYLQTVGRFEECAPAPAHQPLLDAYLAWMRDYRHAAAETLETRRRGVGEFLAALGAKATVEGLSELDGGQVERFFLAYAETKGLAARRSMRAALRTFFRFCLHAGHIVRRLDHAVPALRAYRLSQPPRWLDPHDAQRVLDSIDRESAVGRRDRAILQMLHSYGVRGGQVRALRLGDIRWAEERILFRAMKNGKDSLLPLTERVGASLLDYLRNARPPCGFPEVFPTCRAPWRPLTKANSLSGIVNRRLRAAGVESPSRGAHVFRHGFATRMVAEGHSLKEVADVLGHRRVSTTFHYTKVDFKALGSVALDWPEGVGP